MEIILFSQPSCPQCRAIHMLLDKNNIKYTEIQEISEMEKLGISHTPTLSVDGKLLAGKEIFTFVNSQK